MNISLCTFEHEYLSTVKSYILPEELKMLQASESRSKFQVQDSDCKANLNPLQVCTCILLTLLKMKSIILNSSPQ